MALVEGVKYGLSAADNNPGPGSQHPTGPAARKSVVFVKLTDSALKAIEDYLRSQHKTGGQQPATLQFLGNEGQIHIPSSQAYKGSHSFDFSLSSNADIEGPQGSFECIQRRGPSSLESMGNVPFKLRIHAKDDVYETTRQRMNALEETRKHDCSAKEIKPNGPDIGRKVRKKESKASIPVPAASQYRREPSPLYNNQNRPYLQANNQGNRLKNGSQTINPNNITANNHNSISHIAPSNQSNILNKTTPLNSGPKPYSGSDITRRPLRDRLIHLLALKSFKKPEILSKMHKDGLKEKDKKLLMPLLQSVAVLKNNEYILNRGIWNDIQEDWPFYTEQEKQIMKRRKPQNLTPPGSDCSVGSVSSLSSLSPRSSASTSSGSGLSPPSAYSHVPGTKPTNSPGGVMMNGVFMDGSVPGGKRSADGMDGINEDIAGNKRLRISHFKRPNCATPNSNIPGSNSRLEKDSPPGPGYKDSQSSYTERSPSSQHSMRPYFNNSQAVSNHTQHHSEQTYSPRRTAEIMHRSPNNLPLAGRTPDTMNGDGINHHSASDMVMSPTYANQADDLSHYPPYGWPARNANHESGFNIDSGKLPDSDETDSVDSGNGSSSSSNGSNHHVLPGNNGNNISYHIDYGNGDNSEVNQEDSEASVPIFSHASSAAFKNGHTTHDRSSHEIESSFNVSHYPDPIETSAKQHRQLDRDEASENGNSSFGERVSSKDRERTKERSRDKEGRREREGKKDRDRERAELTEESAVISKYTPIRTPEQKSRYKAEFNADYKEYRKLHAVIDKVSKRFAHLAGRLDESEHGSQDYENVKQQIVDEYNAKKSSPEYMEAKQKFSFLHDKLSHIKKLVLEYDSANPKRRRSSDYASQDEYISH